MIQTKSNPEAKPRASRRISDQTLRPMLGYHLRRASNVIQSDLARTLKPFELRMITFSALAVVADNPGLSQATLADALDIERPNLVVVVDELERRELISRERSATDRRVYQLKITLAGQTLLDKVIVAVAAHEKALLKALTPEMQDTVIAAMTLIKENG